MDDVWPMLLVPVFAGLGVVLVVWHFSRSRSLLERWAEADGYELLHSEYRMLVRGPFFWTSSKGQTVYYVTVRDARGVQRSGYVRCGGWWMGLLSDNVEVRWDDE